MESKVTHYYGVDVSKDELSITLDSQQTPSSKFIKIATAKLKNETDSINEWIETLPPNAHVIFETTGTYSLPLAYCLELAEVAFTIITPSQSKGFAQTLKVSNQTDEIDAALLALYGANHHPEATVLESEHFHHLKQKRKYYSNLMADKQVVDNRLHALSFDSKADTKVLESLYLLQEMYVQQLQAFKDEIYTLTQEKHDHMLKLMTSIVGIGEGSANAIIIATNGLESFETAKQVIKFLGVAPKEKNSGKTVRKKFGITKSGVGYVRATLYSAGQSARRYNLACKALYERLRAKGKCHKVAMIAVVNKMIRQVFAVVKSNTKFDNNFELAK